MKRSPSRFRGRSKSLTAITGTSYYCHSPICQTLFRICLAAAKGSMRSIIERTKEVRRLPIRPVVRKSGRIETFGQYTEFNSQRIRLVGFRVSLQTNKYPDIAGRVCLAKVKANNTRLLLQRDRVLAPISKRRHQRRVLTAGLLDVSPACRPHDFIQLAKSRQFCAL